MIRDKMGLMIKGTNELERIWELVIEDYIRIGITEVLRLGKAWELMNKDTIGLGTISKFIIKDNLGNMG